MKKPSPFSRIILLSAIVGLALYLPLGSPWRQEELPVEQEKEQVLEISDLVEPSTPDSIDLLVQELMETHNVPGVSIAFLKNGKLDATRTYGVVQAGDPTPITPATVFSVGSISKMVNAILTLRMVENDKLDLDVNVNTYLEDWQVEENQYTQKTPVTLRHILSHTAGLTVHGFADYLPNEALPNTIQILNGDGPAKSPRVYVDIPVGSRFRYSGGGTTVVQQIIEEQTDLSYPQAAKEILFDPLGATRSSYENPLPESHGNIAKAHDRRGQPEALPRGYQSMPEMAASGLWTTPSDLAKLLGRLMTDATPNDDNFISSTLIEDMISPEQNSNFGLGPQIEFRDGKRMVYHGGSNDSYKAHFRIFWENQSGYIVFTNGRNGHDLINPLQPVFDRIVLAN